MAVNGGVGTNAVSGGAGTSGVVVVVSGGVGTSIQQWLRLDVLGHTLQQ